MLYENTRVGGPHLLYPLSLLLTMAIGLCLTVRAAVADETQDIACPERWPKDHTIRLKGAEEFEGSLLGAGPPGDTKHGHDIFNVGPVTTGGDGKRMDIHCHYHRRQDLVLVLPKAMDGTCEGWPGGDQDYEADKFQYHYVCHLPRDVGEPELRFGDSLDLNTDLRGFRLRQSHEQIRSVAAQGWNIITDEANEIEAADANGWKIEVVFSETSRLSSEVILVHPAASPSLEDDLLDQFGTQFTHSPDPPYEHVDGQTYRYHTDYHWNKGHGVSLDYFAKSFRPSLPDMERLIDLKAVIVYTTIRVRER